MANLFNVLNVFGKVASKIVKGEDLSVKSSDIALFTAKGNSIKLLESFTLEPIIVVEEKLRGTAEIDKIIKYNIKLFTARQLQLFNALVNIYGKDPLIAFDLISSGGVPGTDLLDSLQTVVGLDSKALFIPDGSYHVGAEASSIEVDKMTGYDAVANVSIIVEDKEVSMPIAIRPKIIYQPIKSIIQVAEDGEGSSFMSAMDDMASGMRSVWDVITGNSLIEEYHDRKIKNKNQLDNYLADRKDKAYSKISNGAVGFNLYYCMYIVDEMDKPYIEKGLRGKFDSKRIADKFFENSKATSIIFYDDSYEAIDIYYLGGNGVSTIDVDALSEKTKDSGADLIKTLISNKSIF
jgi:hypothetical protein